MFIDIIKLFIL